MNHVTSPRTDSRRFRDALGQFATGVTIITAKAPGGQDVGVTANSFNAVSLDPPLVLWNIARNALSLADFQQAGYFAVNVLSLDQLELSKRFAQRGEDKFARVGISRGAGQAPLIDGCAARFQCRTTYTYEGGDHIIFVGEVLDFDQIGKPALLFHRGNYAVPEPHPRAEIESEPVGGFVDDYLHYLLGRAFQQFSLEFEPRVLETGIDVMTWRSLATLSDRDGRTVQELAEIVLETPAVLLELLHRVSAQGLLRLEPADIKAGKHTRVYIKEEGRRRVVGLLAAAKAHEADVLNGFTSEQARLFKDFLRSLLQRTLLDESGRSQANTPHRTINSSIEETRMKKISVIGAGTSGLIFAHALLQKDYDVTLYSDRTAEQWLDEGPPTGTAFIYNENIDIERELGLDYWSEQMFEGDGVLLDFCPQVGADKLVAAGLFSRGGAAVDIRMKVHRWLEDFERAGGHLVIEAVSPDRLDQISQESELTVVATGKADLAGAIPRDPKRSVYDAPQRNLAMVIVEGVRGWGDRIDFTPVKFNFFGDIGEFFWVPYLHKTAGKTWCVLFEAKSGGKLDRFGSCTCADDVVNTALDVMEEVAPWDFDVVRDMRPVEGDPHCWLKGRFPPTVRQGFGRLPSGSLVMPVGDTALAFDPIGGQGGNNAHRHARYVADAIINRGDQPYDEQWMQSVADGFWDYHGRAAYSFNNILLEPLTEAGRLALMTAANDRQFADQMFFGNFASPNGFFPWIEDSNAAREVIERGSTESRAYANQ